jgi:hypothetical protein
MSMRVASKIPVNNEILEHRETVRILLIWMVVRCELDGASGENKMDEVLERLFSSETVSCAPSIVNQ